MKGRLALLASLLACTPAAAQQDDSAGVVPGPQFRRGTLHRLLFGAHYRELWQRPLRVPTLDLARTHGGLVPTERGGGKQTKSLRFTARDGGTWVFRSLAKDPSPQLPPSLRETLVDRIFEDQMSAGHPLAPLLAAPLLDAAGVPHATPRLVRLPDDAALGSFRAEFAGAVGFLEERPADGQPLPGSAAGPADVTSTARLLERLERGDATVDARAFLAARLMDVYLGDWDRHEDQWRWVRTGDGPWRPLPRDRDQAFARFDGLLLDLARLSAPMLTVFGARYPAIGGLTWNGRRLDRRLLPALSWPAWDSTARALQAALTDSAIAAAAGALPPSYGEQAREQLTAALRARRDSLPAAARAFYRLLAREADVHATDRAETVTIRREPGALTVRVHPADDTTGATTFARRFVAGETSEVRLYLHGGRDRVRVTGTGAGPFLHLVPGGGRDSVSADRRPGGLLIHADGDRDDLPRGIPADRRRYRPARFREAAGGHRDWGGFLRFRPWLSSQPDVGLFLGGGLVHYDFGFRKHPWASRVELRAGWATGAGTGRAELRVALPRRNSLTRFGLLARASGIELVRFHGYGNETVLEGTDAFYRVPQSQYLLSPAVTFGAGSPVSLTLGPEASYVTTGLRADRFVTRDPPDGTRAGYGQLAAAATAQLDTRDDARWPTRGIAATLRVAASPAWWDVESTFGSVQGEVATYLTPARRGPTLALRASGRRVWGRYPLHEAAFVGGARSVRGLREQRFAGDAAAWGNAEVRVPLARTFLVLPGEVGVLAVGDAGRVWVAGESSRRWHATAGGGLWLSWLDRGGTLSAVVARGEDRTGFYLRAGFQF